MHDHVGRVGERHAAGIGYSSTVAVVVTPTARPAATVVLGAASRGHRPRVVR